MSNNPYSVPDSTLDYGNSGDATHLTVLPTIVKALAIISLCLGGFNIFGGVCGIAGLSVAAVVTSSPQIQKQMEADPGAAELRKSMADIQDSLGMYLSQIALSVLASIGLIVGGIGVLKRREWGRKWLVYSCVFYVLVTLASWVYTIYITMRNLDSMDSAERSGTLFGMAFGFVFGFIFLAFYVFTAVYMSKASIRRHFQMPA
jgi:hypothetical protein